MKDPVLKEVDGKPKDDLRLSSDLHLDTHTHAYKHTCNCTHRNIIYTYIKKKKKPNAVAFLCKLGRWRQEDQCGVYQCSNMDEFPAQ